ncbi:hypothetical protein THOM_1776, partial [Trachipleistophora hominis]
VNMPKSEKKEEVRDEEPKQEEVKKDEQPEEQSQKEEPAKTESAKNVEPVEEKPEEAKQTEIHIPKIKSGKMQQSGVLMQNDILTVQIDDIVEYVKNRKEMEKLKEGERLEPFIIFLNSRFISTVRHNIRMRRAKTGIIVVVLLIVVGVAFFFAGKLFS